MRAASESRGGEAGTAEVEVEEGRETEDTPAVAAQHRRAENRGRIEDKDKPEESPRPSTVLQRKMVKKFVSKKNG